jgi:hypothetical protein
MLRPGSKSIKPVVARASAEWGHFHEQVLAITRHRGLALKSDGSARRILENLAFLFWTHAEVLENDMLKHWEERRRNAEVLLGAGPVIIRAAKDLIEHEAWIQTRFEVCGTGRLTAKDVGVYSMDYILNLYRLIELVNALAPRLTEVKEKRKARIDHDQNLLLYLMAAYWKLESYWKFQADLPDAAINREIATFVEAWRLSLRIAHGTIDERDIGRRIERFREKHPGIAAQIDSNSQKFILHFLDPSTKGLRP